MRDFNALQVFLTLMQTHSTQRAARKLGRSQSYVSKVLAQLREELDDQLFVRSAEGLSPTSYSLSIEPKLRNAFDQVNQALNPEEFSPKLVDKITLHIAEPYLVASGKQLIHAIRKESEAVIELRTWSKLSESQIEEEEVDLGVHMLNDKSQVFYQKRLHSGAGFFDGNKEGEYVKLLVPGVNEYSNHFQILDPTIEATLLLDNYALMDQLMDECYTLRYAPYQEREDVPQLNVDVALVMKSSKRNSPKIKWLSELVERVINEAIEQWEMPKR